MSILCHFCHVLLHTLLHTFYKNKTRNRCNINVYVFRILAGLVRFELTHARVKVWCLTAWLQPNIYFRWGGRWDSNPRSPVPQTGALTNYATSTMSHAFIILTYFTHIVNYFKHFFCKIE